MTVAAAVTGKPIRAVMSRAKSAAFAGSRAQTRAAESFRTCASAASCIRACIPAPRIAATDASSRARCFAATAPAAAVRTSRVRTE